MIILDVFIKKSVWFYVLRSNSNMTDYLNTKLEQAIDEWESCNLEFNSFLLKEYKGSKKDSIELPRLKKKLNDARDKLEREQELERQLEREQELEMEKELDELVQEQEPVQEPVQEEMDKSKFFAAQFEEMERALEVLEVQEEMEREIGKAKNKSNDVLSSDEFLNSSIGFKINSLRQQDDTEDKITELDNLETPQEISREFLINLSMPPQELKNKIVTYGNMDYMAGDLSDEDRDMLYDSYINQFNQGRDDMFLKTIMFRR